MESRELLQTIARSVCEMDRAKVTSHVEAALAAGLAPMEIIQLGLAQGMQLVGKRFAQGLCFVPEVLMASKALYAGMDLVEPHLPPAKADSGIRVVIGVVAGDVHDIGKNIVKLMLSTSGFTVYDLGKNVKSEQFIAAIQEHQPQVLGISTLMSPTIETMKQTIESVRRAGFDKNLTIMVGGAPLSADLAAEMGADYYSRDADGAVQLLSEKFGLPRGLA